MSSGATNWPFLMLMARAVWAASLAAGVPVAEAMRMANHAAGIVVSKLGTACVTREELAAGAGLAVIEELQMCNDAIGFIAARPPGHHALRDRAMGFCLLNNVAVAAAALTAQGERVAIVDWDVHHGNGTQAIFWNDPNVLYVTPDRNIKMTANPSTEEFATAATRCHR